MAYLNLVHTYCQIGRISEVSSDRNQLYAKNVRRDAHHPWFALSYRKSLGIYGIVDIQVRSLIHRILCISMLTEGDLID